MTLFVSIIHVLACIALILIVLLQAGKGADIGASMGGAGGQALFGTTGATTILSKITTGIAVLFMITSLFLAYQSGHIKETPSVMSDIVPASEQATSKTEVPVSTPAGATGTEKTGSEVPANDKGTEAPAASDQGNKTP